MVEKKDLIFLVLEKEENYPLFYLGDNYSHYLYFSKIEKLGNKKVLVYTDDYCMCDVRNLDMTLNSFVLNRGWI